MNAYVLDSGVYAGHQEFGGRVVGGFDGTGGGRTADCNGHGTHVAGTIAGRSYGVAKEARVVPVRVLNCNGSGRDSWIVVGLDYVVRHHAAGTPAVANLSLGGYVGGSSSPIDAAVKRVIADRVTVVAAAGTRAGTPATSPPPACPQPSPSRRRTATTGRRCGRTTAPAPTSSPPGSA